MSFRVYRNGDFYQSSSVVQVQVGSFNWPVADGLNGYVLTTDGNQSLNFQAPPSQVGEVNTGSNAGTSGVGVYAAKTGVDLQFKNINPSSSKLTVSDNIAQKTIDVDVDESSLSHLNISDIGTNTHAQIDTHIASVANPHSVTLEQARTAGGVLSGNIDMNNNTIINLPIPSSGHEVANKDYVDSVASGLTVKAACRAISTTNLVANYVGTPAFTLTATANVVLPVIDGVTMLVTERLLVDGQTIGTQNGIYVVTSVGVVGVSPWILTRAADFDDDTEIDTGDFVFVEEGTLYENSGWVLATNTPLLDVTSLEFVQFSGEANLHAGNAMEKIGNVFNVRYDGSTVNVNGSNQLEVPANSIGDTELDKANIPISGFGAATVNVDIGGFNLRAQTLQSDVATGTAPLAVASTTMVNNLHSERAYAISTATGQVDMGSAAAPSAGMVIESINATSAQWVYPETLGSNGTFYMFNNLTPTSIPVSGTYYKVAGNTLAGDLTHFTHTTGRLTYTGPGGKFLIVCSFSMKSSNNNRIISFKIGLDGVPCDCSRIDRYVSSGTDSGACSLSTIRVFATNDYVEVFVSDLTSSGAVTVNHMNLSVM